ncbi:glycosyltransferase [Kitasatospora purpeofusca]|uniref:glycosyltransferase n=1 Tax=Kitasatospora purpeofusca TaxID=67352 RepID=UPI0036D0BA15
MISVDTTAFRPRALRAEKRFRALARAVDPNALLDHQALDHVRTMLWTKEASLRPIVISAVTDAERRAVPVLFDTIGQVQQRLPEHLAPVLLLCGVVAAPASPRPTDVLFVPDPGVDGRPLLFAAGDLFLAATPETTTATYEAMATALPVIGTTGGSLEKDIVNGGYDANGWLADDGDSGELVAALVQACLYRPERMRRGTAAAEYIRTVLEQQRPPADDSSRTPGAAA